MVIGSGGGYYRANVSPNLKLLMTTEHTRPPEGGSHYMEIHIEARPSSTSLPIAPLQSRLLGSYPHPLKKKRSLLHFSPLRLMSGYVGIPGVLSSF
jgi:hypothetical protein